MFAHTSWENGDGNVSLYSETGELLAIMEGLELIKTTVDSFLRKLNSERLELPSLYEEVWRPTMSVMRSRVDTSKIQSPTRASLHVAKCFVEIKELEDGNDEYRDSETVDRLFLLYLLRAIQECEWSWPGIGGRVTPSDWKTAAPQHLRQNKLIDSFCKVLEEEGFLVEEEAGKYRIIQNLPSIADCDARIQTDTRDAEKNRGEEDVVLRFTKRCGQLYTSVLQGKVSPLAYMFPEDSNEVGAIRFYSECKYWTYNFKDKTE
jgi:hypothetical protein